MKKQIITSASVCLLLTVNCLLSTLSFAQVIAGGSVFSIALCNDNTARAWGYNAYGQLGDGSKINKESPVQVNGLTGITAIVAGQYNSFALKNDGTVWAWGFDYGFLGNGTGNPGHQTTPVQVNALTGITAIELGSNHCFALKNDGTLWAWGRNSNGQLGDGTTNDQYIPVQIIALTGVVKIVAGSAYSFALKNDGTIWAWGMNSFGQLGDGTTTSKITPVQINTLTGIIDIAAGGAHSVALKNDGTVWAWGRNSIGQLGDGTLIDKLTPVQVSALTGITTIATSLQLFSLALKNDGTVWAWGYNNFGQLGDGTTINRTIPVQVSSLTGIIALAAGDAHAIALKNDGTLWTWGRNSAGQLGDGTLIDKSTPVQVSGLCNVTLTGMDKPAVQNEISIFPNPTTGKVAVSTSVDNNIDKIEIYNVLGEKVYYSATRQISNSTIDISSQPSGVYFMQLQTQNGTVGKKICVER